MTARRLARGIQVLSLGLLLPLLVNVAASILLETDTRLSHVPVWAYVSLAAVVVLATSKMPAQSPMIRDDIGSANRQHLLQMVRERNIKPYLDQLQGHPFANLHMDPELDLVSTRSAVLDEQAVVGTKHLSDLVKDLPHRFLLLGDPGYGKSTVLARIADQFADAAHEDRMAKVPVMLNLAGWTRVNTSTAANFPTWIEREIERTYDGPSRRRVRRLVTGHQLAYFFDGLDEVPSELRSRCVSALNSFIDDLPASTAVFISCRTIEYEALASEVDRNGLARAGIAYRLRPLTDEQQIDALAHCRQWTDLVLSGTAADPKLMEVLAAPLFLDLARQFDTPDSLMHCETSKEIQDALLRALLLRATKQPHLLAGWTRESTLELLSRLAVFITTSEVDRSTFMPEDILRQMRGRDRAVAYLPIGAMAATLSFFAIATLALGAFSALSLGALPSKTSAVAPRLVALGLTSVVAFIVVLAARSPNAHHYDGMIPWATGRKFFYCTGVHGAAAGALLACITFSPLFVALAAGLSWLCATDFSRTVMNATDLRLAVDSVLLRSANWLPADLETFVQWGARNGILRSSGGRGLAFRHRELREVLFRSPEWLDTRHPL